MKPANRKGEMSGRFDRVQTEICKQAKASKNAIGNRNKQTSEKKPYFGKANYFCVKDHELLYN